MMSSIAIRAVKYLSIFQSVLLGLESPAHRKDEKIEEITPILRTKLQLLHAIEIKRHSRNLLAPLPRYANKNNSETISPSSAERIQLTF